MKPSRYALYMGIITYSGMGGSQKHDANAARAVSRLIDPRLVRASNCGYALRMDQKMTALERAFQLARSGSVAGLTEIVASLNREGYSAKQIEGPLLKRQLARLIKGARDRV